MSAENVKWRVNMAVRASNLPPAARLVMLVLSDMADTRTGVIPDKHCPSLASLARDTGHGESTVKAQLAELERLGWVVRIRPNAHERARHVPTRYRVQVGSAGDERPVLKRKPRARSKPSETAFEGQEQALAEGQEMTLEIQTEGQELADRGPGASSSRARSKPSYLKDDDHNDQDDLKASATSADGADAEAPSKPKSKPRKAAAKKAPTDPAITERHQLAEEIVRWWWDGLDIKPAGKNAWFAIVATVEALLKVGYEPRDVAGALRAAGKPVTIPRLEIELEKRNRRPAAARQGSNDQHLADEMEWARQLEAEEAARQESNIWDEVPA